MKKHFFFGTFFFLLLSFQTSAQNTAPTPTNPTTDEANEENSDLVITATVRAKELKFEIVPTPTVDFPGNKPRQTVWEADRENLPPKVEPGVVYRDIGIRLRIYSRFAEIQRIVLEALDEENPPNPPQNQPNPPPDSNSESTTTRKPL